VRNILARAAISPSPPVLILTDGRSDCPTANHHVVSTGSDIFVVLAPAKDDPADDVALFGQRAKVIRQLAPNATIAPLATMQNLVAQWANAAKRARTQLTRVSLP
jgi:hypothetical protein